MTALRHDAPRSREASEGRRTAAAPVRRPVLARVGKWVVLAVLLVLALTVGTTYVKDGSKLAAGAQQFSPAKFAQANFAKVQDGIVKKAVPAAALAAALKKDPAGAAKKYAAPVAGAPGPEFAVSFTGTVGKGDAGTYPVTVAGVPKTLLIRIQTGPAINGTDLRDATGLYSFGQFTNQIDYQNAAAGLNDALKQRVLAKLDPAHLQGKTVSVSGAFQLINPDAWLVTPARLEVR